MWEPSLHVHTFWPRRGQSERNKKGSHRKVVTPAMYPIQIKRASLKEEILFCHSLGENSASMG